MAAARREIWEETSLTSADIELLRAGESYRVDDDELNTEWVVHSFAFFLQKEGRGKDGIEFDHEHTAYEFVKPQELEKRDTVAHVFTSLEKVLLGW